MKARWIFLTIAVVALLALGIGFAFAGRSPNNATPASCAQMHTTSAMGQMHAQMPASEQTLCDTLPAQMGSMMNTGTMGSGMMGGGTMGRSGRHA